MLDRLIVHVRGVLDLGSCRDSSCHEFQVEDEQFLLKVDEYLVMFDLWRAEFGDSPGDELGDSDRDSLRKKLRVLQDLHLEVMTLVEGCKDSLNVRLGDINRKVKAFRSYVDRYPSRVNITGIRKF